MVELEPENADARHKLAEILKQLRANRTRVEFLLQDVVRKNMGFSEDRVLTYSRSHPAVGQRRLVDPLYTKRVEGG